ncbi:MAG TPA: hypothetical protein ENK60_09105 [Anaerolineae bacterium]|nr:hypothetical protein [Anaerolineae bacterium]
MVDWSFIATIGIIFLSSLVAAWLRFRRRDVCLASFHGFHVTMELANGRRVWGIMEVLPTGIEMHYRNAVQDDSHLETSYLLYDDEFSSIQAIYRYADDLSPEKAKQREKAIEKAFHPNIVRRSLRKARIFVSNASESLNEVIGMAIGRARKPVGNIVTETSESHLKKLGTEALGHVGHRADPLLERLVGNKVVFEMVEDDVVHEHVGVFKNYSADFLEILDVQFPCKERIPINRDEARQLAGLEVSAENDVIRIRNGSPVPVMLLKLTTTESEQLLDVVVDSGGEVTLFSQIDFVQAILHARIVRELDMIVPRSRAVVRHRAEVNTAGSFIDIIFDVGVRLPWSSKDDKIMARLYEKLEANPMDVCSMAVLGRILLENGEFDEAEDWLKKAYAMRFSLPDNGRSVSLHLQEIARHRTRTATLLTRAVHSPTIPTSDDFTVVMQDAADV